MSVLILSTTLSYFTHYLVSAGDDERLFTDISAPRCQGANIDDIANSIICLTGTFWCRRDGITADKTILVRSIVIRIGGTVAKLTVVGIGPHGWGSIGNEINAKLVGTGLRCR